MKKLFLRRAAITVVRYGPDWLHDKIAAGDLVVIDGAMGTELEARGVPMNEKAWSGAAMLSDPEVVRAAHADYISAGAEVIITNTFAAGPYLLGQAGLGDEMAGINKGAVEVARQARDEAAHGPVAIAGSMCPWVGMGEELPDAESLSEGFRVQADLLAEAGVELIALEMCSHPVYSRLITEAAVATGLPVVHARRRSERRRLGHHACRTSGAWAVALSRCKACAPRPRAGRMPRTIQCPVTYGDGCRSEMRDWPP